VKRPFWLVFSVELKSLRRDRRLWSLLGLLFAVAVYAALGGGAFARFEQRTIRDALAAEDATRRNLAEQARGQIAGAPGADAGDPHRVGAELLPRVAALPHAPFAVLAVGQRDVHPQLERVTTATRASGSTTDDGSSPSRRAAGAFDLAFVLVFLLPLLVIALAYDLCAGERERGTLALVLSQPVSLTTFVFAKASARAAVVAAAALPIGLILPILSGGSMRGAAVPGLLLALALIGYIAFWFALAMAVDAWGRATSTNALALIGLWLGLLFVVPGLLGVAVDTLAPTPSRAEMLNAARDAAREAEGSASDLAGDHGKRVDASQLGRRALEVDSRLEEQLAPVTTAFESRRRARERWVDGLRFASPGVLMHEALVDVAGSGSARNRAFQEQVASFQADLEGFFHPRIERGERLDADDYAEMPAFAFREPGAPSLLRRVLPAILAIAVAACLCAWWASRGLARPAARDVR
jgi:ABC-2 type transport system permease protein